MKNLIVLFSATLLLSCKNETPSVTEQKVEPKKETVVLFNTNLINNVKADLEKLRTETSDKQVLLNNVIALHSQYRITINNAAHVSEGLVYDEATKLVKDKGYTVARINQINDSLLADMENKQHYKTTDSVLTAVINEFKNGLN